MTERHLHCVYFKYDDPNRPDGYCLLHHKKIERGYAPHCPDIVLRPRELLQIFIKHEGICDNWDDAWEKGENFLKLLGFKDYPARTEVKNKRFR